VPLSAGSTVFTVSSVGLTTGTAQLQVAQPPYVEQLLSSSLIIFTNQTAELTFTLSVDGQGLKGANVAWSAVGGTVAPSSSTTNSQGQAVAYFTPTSVGTANITAAVSSPETGTKTLNSLIGVRPTPPRPDVSVLKRLTTFPYYLILAGAVAGAVIVAMVLVRRRGRAGESEEEQGDFMFFRLPRLPKGGFADIARTLR